MVPTLETSKLYHNSCFLFSLIFLQFDDNPFQDPTKHPIMAGFSCRGALIIEVERVEGGFLLKLRTLGTLLYYTTFLNALSEFKLSLELREYQKVNFDTLLGLPYNDLVVCRSLMVTRSELMHGHFLVSGFRRVIYIKGTSRLGRLKTISQKLLRYSCNDLGIK